MRYGRGARPLSELWWDEYQAAIEQLPERLFLVISERPVEFKTEKAPPEFLPLLVNTVGFGDFCARVVVVDFSSVRDKRKRPSDQ